MSFTDKILEKALGDSSAAPVKKIEVNKPRKTEIPTETEVVESLNGEQSETAKNTDTQEETVHVAVAPLDAPVVVMEPIIIEEQDMHMSHSPDPILETPQEIADEEAFDLLPKLKSKSESESEIGLPHDQEAEHIFVTTQDIPVVIPMITENGTAHTAYTSPIYENISEIVDTEDVVAPSHETVLSEVQNTEEVTAPHKAFGSEIAEMELVQKKEIELSPLERMPVHRDQYFKLETGTKPIELRSIKELILALSTMDSKTWNHHVHGGRNDFANWIEHVFHDKKLADDMKDFPNAHTLRIFLKNAF